MALNRLLVVGGNGFIGRHICRAAIKAGYSVTSLSLKPRTVENEDVRELYADVTDTIQLATLLKGEKFEYVINSGGYIDHRHFRNGGRALIRGHFDGTQNLIELLDRDYLTRFIQLGSSDEYGGIPAPQREDQRESAISPYSLAKIATTQLLQMLWRSEHFPAVTLRLFLTYGPGQGNARFLPQLIFGCLNDKTFPVSEGRQIRDFCHVTDIARGIVQALQAPNKIHGEVINLASGVPMSIRSVIEQVQKFIGKGNPEYGKIPFREGENPSLYADIEKASRFLAWRPEITFIDGLNDTINFYRNTIDV